MMQLSREQARRFMLLKQGLIGPRRYRGKAGALAFFQQVRSIQFDPIDVVGRNPDLVLQSRVSGYAKPMLHDLLYRDRVLVDYFDKELCIFPVEDWPHFAHTRARHQHAEIGIEGIAALRDEVLAIVGEKGALNSAQLGLNERVTWYWGQSRKSRAVLEYLYYSGDLCIHHKRGSSKYYDLASRCLPAAVHQAPDPHPDRFSRQRWLTLRRINAIGLLWNRASPAWLGFGTFTAQERAQVFAALEAEGRILPLRVEGIKAPLYCLSEDEPFLERALQDARQKPRCELIAPLDPLIWDRTLIKALFDFDYTWEIYTPPQKRKYGYYVLPLLYGSRLIGRVEPLIDKTTGALSVKQLWPEPGVTLTGSISRAIDACLANFEDFHKRSQKKLEGSEDE